MRGTTSVDLANTERKRNYLPLGAIIGINPMGGCSSFLSLLGIEDSKEPGKELNPPHNRARIHQDVKFRDPRHAFHSVYDIRIEQEPKLRVALHDGGFIASAASVSRIDWYDGWRV